MKMSLTYYEKIQFSQQVSPFLDRLLFETNEYSVLLFKVLALSLKDNDSFLHQWDESIFADKEKFRECFDSLLKHAVAIAETSTEDIQPKSYVPTSLKTFTSGELAKYFGVSQTTITNWHKEGRFEGITYHPGKQLRVPEDTRFRLASGGVIPISEVVEMWHKENGSVKEDTELEFLTRQVALYEEKYKGEFRNTIGRKPQENWTVEEETDARAWQYFLSRQANVFRD
ncbi:helix-turn-helix domain-containing protein [Paenibacillus dendritiformis]|uniref:helix-turn-helix domain-containing protein n=1 Tax=Paenibacillus dendritiformis TaxID=130049 RepID=UPI00248B7B45|nr:helix-turn-helix domain-containing protein [Paenibacillus dendritiformis]WGU93394.1 helix-turn-helix domain-containing protein [Paenibacillus dendritiformis]